MACHYCINCGRCRGELPQPIFVRRCLVCGWQNQSGQESCAACGASLKLIPGVSNFCKDANVKLHPKGSDSGSGIVDTPKADDDGQALSK
jgi:hypothetical protein